MKRIRLKLMSFLLAAGALTAGSASADAINVAAATPSGSTYAGVCAGQEAYGSLQNPGTSIPATIPMTEQGFNTCKSETIVGDGATAQQSSFGNGIPNGPITTPFNNQISFTAAVGLLTANATGSGSSEDLFAGAAGGGGWSDAFPWFGQTGLLTMDFSVDGLLTESGSSSGEAVMELAPTIGGNLLTGAPFNAFSAANGNTGFGGTLESFDFEAGIWTADATVHNVLADQTLKFMIPVVHGQMVNFGMWMTFMVATGDGGDPTEGMYAVDPPTVTYAGPGGLVLPGGTTVGVDSSDFGTSVSGFDYSQPITPEPATLTLLLVGGAGLLKRFRKQRA